MIITAPNDFVAEVHDRMPVLLTEEQFAPWLSGEAGMEYLKPAPAADSRTGLFMGPRLLGMGRQHGLLLGARHLGHAAGT
jgi:hypothetical protein